MAGNLTDEYNSRAVSMNRYSINDFIASVGGTRVAMPSRTISATPTYNSEETPHFVESDDGMFFIVENFLFPIPEIRGDQRFGLSHTYRIQGPQELDRLAPANVIKIENPGLVVRKGDSWYLNAKGTVTLSKKRTASDSGGSGGGLTSKLTITFALIIGAMGLAMIPLVSVGNVISNTSKISNIFQVIFILIGLGGAYFYVKKHRSNYSSN